MTASATETKSRVVGRIFACGRCGRRILVEHALLDAVQNTIDIVVTCWDCIDDDTKKRAIEGYSISKEALSLGDKRDDSGALPDQGRKPKEERKMRGGSLLVSLGLT